MSDTSVLMQAGAEIISLRREIDRLYAELAEAKAALVDADRIVDGVGVERYEMQAELEQAKARIAGLTSDLVTVQHAIASQGTKIPELAAQLADRDRRIAESEASLAKGAEIISRLEQRDAQHLARTDRAEAELADRDRQIADLEKKLAYETGLKDSIEGALLAKTSELYPDLQRQIAALRKALEEVITEESGQVCGACGQPWTGEKCGQADNDHPFNTCYPVADASPLRNQLADRDRQIAVLRKALEEVITELPGSDPSGWVGECIREVREVARAALARDVETP